MALLTFPAPASAGPSVSEADRSSSARTLQADFGDGYSQRAADGINAVRSTYAVAWSGITRVEASACDTFLRNRGGHEAFLWTPPGGVSTKWICKEWRVRHTTATLEHFSATFVEVFDQTT